ncbi:MAG: relaxase domain-containing protein [Pseudonocardiales bacterium]|nr:relaxase domain-containing protein [Pseudonocardiales bacterium]
MLSLSPGHDTSYLTDAVGGGREGYYSAAVTAGEPPGMWYGAGADALGLIGQVDADLMEAIYSRLLDPRDPNAHDRSTWGQAETVGAGHKHYRSAQERYDAALAANPGASPEQRAEMWRAAEQNARQATAFIDATFSPPKSWSIASVAFERASNLAYQAGDAHSAAYWEDKHRAIEQAVLVGARASIDYLQDHAGYGRVGKHGPGATGRWIDAHGWVVAQFLQHDSREHDPQLHVHQAILNRQLCADGQWRALDSTAIKQWRAGAAAVGERVAAEYAAQHAGLRFQARADGNGLEVAGVPAELIELFSKRTEAIDPRAEAIADEFRARYGREPSLHEWTQMRQQATLETRAPKSHDGLTAEERMDRWVAETQARVGQDLAATAESVVAAGAVKRETAQWSPCQVSAQALAEIGDRRSSWQEADLTRAIGQMLPANLGCKPEMVPELLDGLTQQSLGRALPARTGVDASDAPAELKLADGRSVYEAPGARTYSTEDAVVGERLLRQAAVTRGGATLTMEQAQAVVDRYAESHRELGADQQAALVGVLTSGAMLETLCAPAGTGKSFVVGAINDAWTEAGKRMQGLAATQRAADILADEGLTSSNITRWLAAQGRLEAGRALPGDEQYQLGPDVIVAIDEASMAPRSDILAIQQKCAAAGAKTLLVGDAAQLTPVGPGGVLADVAEHGLAYELTQVRRFEADWEKTASLGLRAGDKAAVAEYGRLRDGGAVEQTEAKARQAWLADTLEGKESLLVAQSNEAAARLSAALREELVALGKVGTAGVALGMQGTVAGVGDMVQARRNAWSLKGWEGNTIAPVNRATYEVTALRDDGGLTVAPILAHGQTGRELGPELQLPATYVDKHLTLGYASTVYAAEGRTVKTCHGLLTPGMDAAAAYVAATRGTEHNTLWGVTRAAPAKDSATGEVAQVIEHSTQGMLCDILDWREIEQTALAEAEQAARDAQSALTNGGRLIDSVGMLLAHRTSQALDALVAEGVLAEHDRARFCNDDAMWSVDTMLRRAELAGHDPLEVLRDAVSQRDFDGADSAAQVLHGRLDKMLDGKLTPQVERFSDLIPAQVPETWNSWLGRHADAADDRRTMLGEEIARERPQWAIEALGPVPEDPVERLEWEDKAGAAGVARELLGHDDPTDALGAAPPANLPDKHAMWYAGHAALGLPDAGPDDRAASDGQLFARIAAYERELNWAPAYVADELEAVAKAADDAGSAATVLAAKAAAEPDAQRAEMLRNEAQQAQAQAAILEEQRAGLERGDLNRALWSASTAVTKDRAEAAKVTLAARGIDVANPPDKTTATEWVEAHRAEQAEAEAAMVDVAEADIADEGHDAEMAEADAMAPVSGPIEETGLAETAIADIRETTAPDPFERSDEADRGRVPTPSETHKAVVRASEAVAEMQAREALDELADQEPDVADVARWGDGTEDTQADDLVSDDEPVVTYDGPADPVIEQPRPGERVDAAPYAG